MDNKTEKATPKKRKDQRKKGNIFQSKEITTAIVTLAAFLFLSYQLPVMGNRLKEFFIQYLSLSATTYKIDTMMTEMVFKDVVKNLLLCILPLAMLLASCVIASTFLQTRLYFSGESLKFKFSKLNPLNGIKRMFSLKSVVEVLKSVFKILLFIACFYWFISRQIAQIPHIQSLSLTALLGYIFSGAQSLVWLLLLIFIVIAVFDFAYQKWDYEKKLMMSKQEIKQEYKEQEGDPQVKGKMRELQRNMASGRMMQKVPQADVIIKNPTHYAVALKFDINKKIAPVVIAKGADEIALKIIEIAENYDIPTTENIPLARALYANVEIDSVIPKEYYNAVAQVLAWVYSIKKKA